MDQNSGFGSSLVKNAWDVFQYSTWRNPFVMKRIGGSGWDPLAHKYMSKLNPLLAPEAHGWYKHLSEARGGVGPITRRGMKLASELKGAGVDISSTTTRSLGQALTMNEGTTGVERYIGQRIRASGGSMFGGHFAGKLNKSLYMGGRVLNAVSGVMWAYDIGKFAFGVLSPLAAYGAAQRNRPRVIMGSGIADNPVAASMRQQAIQALHGSQLGPRSLIGNESQFLHT